MGVEFSIAKRDPPETYYLGKPTLERRGSDAKTPSTSSDDGGLADVANVLRESDPGFYALWSIMGSADYAVFTLDQSARDALAGKLWRGSRMINAPGDAETVADDIIAWAGDGELVLVTDEDHEDVEHLGFGESEHYRETGSIMKALASSAK